MKTGQVTMLPPDIAVEITDLQGNIALLILADPQQAAVSLITHTEEAERAHNYARTHGVQFSRVLAPDLSGLTAAPAPSPFNTKA